MSTEKKINKIIIISSPSGAGKTTICNYLVKKLKTDDIFGCIYFVFDDN